MTHQKIIIKTDGGSRGNPGPAAIGVHAVVGDQILFQLSEFLGHATNNFAEYTAVIHSLRHLQSHQISSSEVSYLLDSELVVKQLNGLYKVKDPNIQKLYQEVKSLISQLISTKQVSLFTFSHIPREQNKIADSLVNSALDSQL